METSEKNVVANIVAIRKSLKKTKREVAKELCVHEASYSRIESGQIALSYDSLARLASFYKMRVIDIITYPDKYEKVDKSAAKPDPVEAVLQIKLTKEKKEQVFKLVFGDNNIEILNK